MFDKQGSDCPNSLAPCLEQEQGSQFPLRGRIGGGMPSPDPALLSSLYGQLNWKALLLEKRHPRPKALNIFHPFVCACTRAHSKGCAHPHGLVVVVLPSEVSLGPAGFPRYCTKGKKKRNIAYMACSGFPKSILINLVAKIKNIRNKTTTQFYMFLHTSDACLSRIQQAVPVINTIKIIPSTRHTS